LCSICLLVGITLVSLIGRDFSERLWDILTKIITAKVLYCTITTREIISWSNPSLDLQ
jgi:hypothetical protein